MKFRYNKYLFLVVTLLLVISTFSNTVSPAMAWGGNSHQELSVIGASFLENVADELGTNGERWAQLFQIYESDLKLGSVYPDRTLGDSTNHVYHIEEETAIFRNTPNVVQDRYNEFKNNLISGNYSGAVWVAGVMAHYIVDLCQPMHTAGASSTYKEHDERGPGGVDSHWKYEQEVNAKLSNIVFTDYTPSLLNKSVKESTIDCAQFSYQYYYDLVEFYWNGTFWNPWVEEITIKTLNLAAQQFSNILLTAIKEANVTLPDFTPLAINLELEIQNQLYQGEKYSPTLKLTNWQNEPLDANIDITTTLVTYSDDNSTELISKGPFIVLFSRDSVGVYTFDLEFQITGIIFLDILITKPNMISKHETIEITILSNDSFTDTTTNTSDSSTPTTANYIPITIVLSILLAFALTKTKMKK